jgi:DNA-binding IclR family transcriptional regulator
VPRRGAGPDFIEALARGLEVIAAFKPGQPAMSLSQVAGATGLARPTARRILLTLEELGYVRSYEAGSALTPRVLELGVAYVRSMGLWDIARPHTEHLVERTGESCSVAQFGGTRSGPAGGASPWLALTDEQLAPGIRSVAAPLRDGSGRVVAALNVNAHAAETSVERLVGEHLPLLLQTAGDISADFARVAAVPHV